MTEEERCITALDEDEQQRMARLCLQGYRFFLQPNNPMWRWHSIDPMGVGRFYSTLLTAIYADLR